MSLDAIILNARRQALFSPGESTEKLGYNIDNIKRILPHRAPMLLIDHIDLIDREQRGLLARRLIDADDPVFSGHFPGEPVYPGVLLLEAMSQAAVSLQILLYADLQMATKMPSVRLLRVYDSLFQLEVLPGDEITLLAKQIEKRSYTALYSAQAMRDGKVCALTMVELYLTD